ncbi:MAG: GntR family transcriptional regulator [Dehalococcoidia bacterium]|jgi:GntR family transcriptional regulator|nr:GntR family transcriptional regulator [Dehalococcoidia bacterium]
MTNRTGIEWLSLNTASSTPLHRQIDEGVKIAIAMNRLRAGDRLPTVRGLADHMGIHPNTVSRAYSGLVRDGVLVAQPGRGTFVPSEVDDLGAERQVRLDSIITRSLVRALSLGFPLEQIEASFTREVAGFREDIEDPVKRGIRS